MRESRHPPLGQVVAGHYDVKHGFRSFRAAGTRDFQLMLSVGGRARIGTRSGDIIVAVPAVLLFRPGTLHDYGPAARGDRWEYHWIHFIPRPHFRELLGFPEAAPGLGRIDAPDPRSVRRLQALHARLEALTPSAPRRELRAMHLVEEILLECSTWVPVARGWDPRILRAIEEADRNEARTVSDLARRAGLSVSRFAHLFRSEVGTSPRRFIEVERLERARRMLESTTRSVKEIAAALGFSSAFHLSARFKQYTGHAPRPYRALFVAGKIRFSAPTRLGDSRQRAGRG